MDNTKMHGVKLRGEYRGLRNEVGVRIRLRQDTINIALVTQSIILVIAILSNAIYPEDKDFSNLLFLTPLIGFIYQLILLDHQVKTMIAVLYLKSKGQSGWQRFYDRFTYEHPRMQWVSSLLGLLDPGAPALLSVVSLGLFVTWQDSFSLIFWIVVAALILIQVLSLVVGLYLIRSRLPASLWLEVDNSFGSDEYTRGID